MAPRSQREDISRCRHRIASMRLVVLSYKTCWASSESPTGYATHGGFPFQMAAISELFDETTLVLPQSAGPPPAGLVPLLGHRLDVAPIPEPAGRDLRRKLALLAWLPLRLPALWRSVGRADAVHGVVPGDIGTLGIGLAILRRKPLFVRHCGTWGRPTTLANRVLHHLLVRIAGGRNVVFATGGGSEPPEVDRAGIHWIFSTSLTRGELRRLPRAEPHRPGEPWRLMSIGRLARAKNVAATIRALAQVRREHEAVLDVLGQGEELEALRTLATEVGVAGAVTFHGNVAHDRLLRKLAEAHLLVFPTRVAEGFPKVVLEAMACGVPVLATRVSVVPQLLGEGRGFLLEETTPQAVAHALRRRFADPESLTRAAERARRHVEGYTLERWGRAIGEKLEEAWQVPLRRGGADL